MREEGVCRFWVQCGHGGGGGMRQRSRSRVGASWIVMPFMGNHVVYAAREIPSWPDGLVV